MSKTIKIRRDTAARWAANNPTPHEGELCIVIDSTPQRMKIGDGVTAFNSLPYVTLPNATTSAAGLMSAADKTKLNGIATSAIDAARATDIALEMVERAVGMAVLADFAIPADNNYTLCSSEDLKLMVIDGMAYTDGKADLSAGNYRAAFVFADPLTIPANAFKGIVELTVVHLPSYVHSIGEQTFADCAALGKVYCEGITPPAVEADSFDNLDLATMQLTVHKVVETEYQNDAFWGTFGTINNF